jgi:hypothetical protein
VKVVFDYIGSHMGETLAVYILGGFVTFYLCAVHWREKLKNNNNDFWDSPANGSGGMIFFPFLWPLIAVFTLPIYFVVQLIKFVYHLGVYGDLTPRLAAITRRANR